MELAKRWRWLGIEFLVIVLGVLSALFVDTWVEDRQNAERAEVYRERLILDIKRDISNLDAVTEYYGNVRRYGLLALADLENDQPLDEFSLMHAAFNAAEEWGFVLESATYNDLQSTGGLALLDDVQLRIDLADYHRIGKSRESVWNLQRDFRAVARGIIPNDLQAAIHYSCNASIDDDDSLPALELFSGGKLPANVEPLTGSAVALDLCGLNPADFDLEEAAAEFRADPEIPRLLRYRISQLRVATALFEGHKQFAKQLVASLEGSG